MKTIVNAILAIIVIMLILLTVWFLFSLAEVWIHGWATSWEYNYSDFNLFVILLSL